MLIEEKEGTKKRERRSFLKSKGNDVFRLAIVKLWIIGKIKIFSDFFLIV